MENGTIPDENITASSSASAAPPHLGRLNGLASWCTGKADGCYLQKQQRQSMINQLKKNSTACLSYTAWLKLTYVVQSARTKCTYKGF